MVNSTRDQDLAPGRSLKGFKVMIIIIFIFMSTRVNNQPNPWPNPCLGSTPSKFLKIQ